jgi:phosphohistidine phosphatase
MPLPTSGCGMGHALVQVTTTVRRAILVRHAHAEWPNYTGRDFDRQLTPQGLEDARRTAEAIREAGHMPGVLLTSPAVRTLQTTGFIATALGLPEHAVRQIPGLYNASAQTLYSELGDAFAMASTVILVAHNPGISELARMITYDELLPPFRPGQWQIVTLRE